MAYVGKTYKHEKDDNFDGFIDSLGISGERAAVYKSFKPSNQLKKDGDSYILVTNDIETKFKSGVEFESTAPFGNEHIKTVITVDGNTVTQVQTFDDGRSITFKRVYSDDKLVLTITTSFWDGAATRYYTAA